jgi:hypothetical protein
LRPHRNRDGRPTRSTSPRPPSYRWMIGRTVGKRHRRIRARSATGQVAGRPTRSSGSRPIVQRTGLPNLRSPKRPLSQSGDRSHRPGRSLRGAVSCPEGEARTAGTHPLSLRQMTPGLRAWRAASRGGGHRSNWRALGLHTLDTRLDTNVPSSR